MQAKVNAVTSTRVTNCLTALITLDRTLKHRAGDSRPTSTTPHLQWPTEAINGRLKHLHGSTLGLRNLTHYTTRALHENDEF